MPPPLRVLCFSTLYPNAVRPSHGVFVETRLKQLIAYSGIEARVVAPVPWFPFTSRMFGRYGEYARVPATEVRSGIEVSHPRFLAVPRIGTAMNPYLLAASARRAVRQLQDTGFDFDLIDAHYAYPDGIAAWMLARELGKPFVITARGSDLYRFPQHPVARRLIIEATDAADAVITVSHGLKRQLARIGGRADVAVLRNGIDLNAFRLFPRNQARKQLTDAFGLNIPAQSRVVVSAASLVPLKGHDLLLDAISRLKDLHLCLAGDGPSRNVLLRRCHELGVQDRVHFLGVLDQPTLNLLFSAADVSVLASSQEGWANVLLESMASGTPIVASRIEGTDEVVTHDVAGRLVDRSAAAIAQGIESVLAAETPQASVRAFAERFSWDETSAGQLSLFESIVARQRGAELTSKNAW